MTAPDQMTSAWGGIPSSAVAHAVSQQRKLTHTAHEICFGVIALAHRAWVSPTVTCGRGRPKDAIRRDLTFIVRSFKTSRAYSRRGSDSMRPLKRRSASSRQLRSMSRIKNDLRIHHSLGKENGLHHIGAHARVDFITIVSEYDSSSRTAHYHLPLSPPGSTWRSPADVAAARQPRSSPHSY